MTHTYKVTGMTCSGCVATVEKSLSEINGVQKVSAHLDTSKVEIETDKHISIQKLRASLPDKYHLENDEEVNVFSSVNSHSESQKSDIQQLFPLFLIFIFISGASILLNIKPWDLENAVLDFMGLFYVVFSFFKFLDLKGFPKSFAMYDPLAKVLPVYGWAYPFIELALGLMFLMRFQISAALIITLIILGTTTFGVTRSLLNKDAIRCACLGTALNLPMTTATFIENTIMIVMAFIMLIKTYA